VPKFVIHFFLFYAHVGWMDGDMWMWDVELLDASARFEPMH
jgi:hypothetical protein